MITLHPGVQVEKKDGNLWLMEAEEETPTFFAGAQVVWKRNKKDVILSWVLLRAWQLT
jgi:hypothetical protein